MKMELSERARELRNETMRKYRKAHRDQVREYNRRYWEKKALRLHVTDDHVTDIPVTSVTPVTSGTAVCLVCGKSFIAVRSDAKYCSDKCRQKYYRDTKQLC